LDTGSGGKYEYVALGGNRDLAIQPAAHCYTDLVTEVLSSSVLLLIATATSHWTAQCSSLLPCLPLSHNRPEDGDRDVHRNVSTATTDQSAKRRKPVIHIGTVVKL
jgi:hypothetical protein